VTLGGEGVRLRLRILGCSGTYPTAADPSTGYVVEDPTASILLDCGTGTFASMQRHGVDFAALDALVLTHTHSDHCLDVFPLYYARRFTPGLARLPLYCPSGTEAHLSQMLIGDSGCRLANIFDFHEVTEGDVVEVGDVRVEFFLTDHPVPTHAVRATSPTGTITFSADTGPAAELDVFARGSHVLLCEATYLNSHMGAPLHLSAEQAGGIAKRAEVADLIITHFWPTHDRARSKAEAEAAVGDIPVHLASTGAVFDVRERRWV
jgi:ribonuclease BN (tRNA processing enzyme)